MTYPSWWPCQIIDKSLSGHCHLKNTCAKDLKVRRLHRENTWHTANGLADDASPPRCRGRSVQVLNKGNGIDLGHCPNQLRRDFFEAYKDDPQMKAVRDHCTATAVKQGRDCSRRPSSSSCWCCCADRWTPSCAITRAGCARCSCPSTSRSSSSPARGEHSQAPPLRSHALAVPPPHSPPPPSHWLPPCRYEIGRHSPSRWALWNENLKKIAANPRNVVAANNLYDAEYIK